MSDDIDDTPEDDAKVLTKEELVPLLKELKREHMRINNQVDALHENGVMDMLKLKRMKKAKLALKDKIAYVENMLTPDIIA